MDVWIDRQNMPCRQPVFPSDFDRMSLQHIEEGARVSAFVSPQPRGWKLRVQLLGELHHANAILRFASVVSMRLQLLQNRQRVDVSIESSGRAIGCRRRSEDLLLIAVSPMGKKQCRYGSSA